MYGSLIIPFLLSQVHWNFIIAVAANTKCKWDDVCRPNWSNATQLACSLCWHHNTVIIISMIYWEYKLILCDQRYTYIQSCHSTWTIHPYQSCHSTWAIHPYQSCHSTWTIHPHQSSHSTWTVHPYQSCHSTWTIYPHHLFMSFYLNHTTILFMSCNLNLTPIPTNHNWCPVHRLNNIIYQCIQLRHSALVCNQYCEDPSKPHMCMDRYHIAHTSCTCNLVVL